MEQSEWKVGRGSRAKRQGGSMEWQKLMTLGTGRMGGEEGRSGKGMV